MNNSTSNPHDKSIPNQLSCAPFIQYIHHGKLVWVNSILRGLHRDHCLCHHCSHFHPMESSNCRKAQELYEYCVLHDMTTPVYECPDFLRIAD